MVGYRMIAFLALGLGVALQAAGPRAVGYVYKVQGSFFRAREAKQLISGDPVFAGESISSDFQKEGYFTVLMLDTGVLWTKRCTTSAPCEGSFSLPQTE